MNPTVWNRRIFRVLLGFAILGTLVLFFQEIRFRGALNRLRYPYVILVTLDTLNINYTSPYNPKSKDTPQLARFASEGVLFKRAYTLVPVTMPSHTTIMTGLSPATTGVMANGDQLKRRFTTLAEYFEARGYQTAAFISLGVMKRAFGLDQGFQAYDDYLPPNRWYRNAREVYRSVQSWILTHMPAPFFIWIHLSDPHEPYLTDHPNPDTLVTLDGQTVGQYTLTSKEVFPLHLELSPGEHKLAFTSIRPHHPDDRPDTGILLSLVDLPRWKRWAKNPAQLPGGEVPLKNPFEIQLVNASSRTVRNTFEFTGKLKRPPPSEVLPAYRAEVARVDSYLGKIQTMIHNLQLDDRTLWVIVSDHGEGLFHHNALGHAAFLYEDQLRVMWIMRGPGIPAGKQVDFPVVTLADVTPTILSALGIRPATALNGHSLWKCIRRDNRCPEGNEHWAFSVNHTGQKIAGVAFYRWPMKIMRDPRVGTLLYDLSKDPTEDHNLLLDPTTKQNASVRALIKRYQRLGRLMGRTFSERERSQLSDTDRQMLKSLGYVNTSQ